MRSEKALLLVILLYRVQYAKAVVPRCLVVSNVPVRTPRSQLIKCSLKAPSVSDQIRSDQITAYSKQKIRPKRTSFVVVLSS